MNFVSHEKDIKALLTSPGGRQYSGCYIYSRDEIDKTKKIGMSQAGLFRRLKQAKSCYPYQHEFWLQFVIISLDIKYKNGIRSNTIQIENALHNESKHLSTVKMQEESNIPEQGKRPREYRVLSSDTQLQNLLKKTLNQNRSKWDFIVVFSKTGWNIIPNNRIVHIPITSIAKLKQKKNANMKQTIYSLPLNRTKLILPKGVKVGDIIPASDNWDKFTVVKIISKKHIVAKFKGDKTLYDIKL